MADRNTTSISIAYLAPIHIGPREFTEPLIYPSSLTFDVVFGINMLKRGKFYANSWSRKEINRWKPCYM